MCDIPDLQLIEDFQAPPFQQTSSIQWVHERTPRFGHSNELLDLMTGTPEEQSDYVKGLIASSFAIFGLFLVWLIWLAVFHCMGPKEVGILSGKPRPLPPMPADNAGELVAWRLLKSQRERTLDRLRMIVCICGMVIVISACLLSVQGVSSLTRSLDDGTEALALIQSLTKQAIALVNRVVEQNEVTASAVQDLLQDINFICPLQKPNGICTNIKDANTCDFDGIFGDGAIIVSTIRHFQEEKSSPYFKDLVSAKRDLKNFLALTDDLMDQADSFNWALYCAMFGSLILMIICMFIIFGMAFPGSRVVKCLRKVFLVPTFTVMVIISFCFSMVFVVGSMAVGDLCYDSPDQKIVVILDRFREQLSPIAVEVASFYINACPAEAIPSEISDNMNIVLSAIPTLGNFTALVNQNTNLLQDFCGFPDPAPLVVAAEAANVQLCQIVDLLNSIRIFFQCKIWFPLYETAVYEAICYNGTQGFAWIASTQFVIVFFACLLLTCRAAFHEVTIERQPGDTSDSDNNNSRKSAGSRKSATAISNDNMTPATTGEDDVDSEKANMTDDDSLGEKAPPPPKTRARISVLSASDQVEMMYTPYNATNTTTTTNEGGWR